MVDAMQAAPRRGPDLQLPAGSEFGLEWRCIVRDLGCPRIVSLNGCLEMESEFNLIARRHGLKFVVDLWVAVVQLEDCPHDRAAGWAKP